MKKKIIYQHIQDRVTFSCGIFSHRIFVSTPAVAGRYENKIEKYKNILLQPIKKSKLKLKKKQ